MDVEMMNARDLCVFLAGSGRAPLSATSLANFVKSGMPQVERGIYDPIACAHWYLGQLRERKGVQILPRTRTAALEALLSEDFRETLGNLVRDALATQTAQANPDGPPETRASSKTPHGGQA